MTKPDIELYREKLLALRARLRGDMMQMEDNALSKDHSKTTSTPNDLVELGADIFDQEITFRMVGSGKNALDQIDGALARIESGSYGRCEECGVKIPKPRLEAVPYTALCVRCASREEEDRGPGQHEEAGHWGQGLDRLPGWQGD